jgi:hypothetical protein
MDMNDTHRSSSLPRRSGRIVGYDDERKDVKIREDLPHNLINET